MRNLLFILAAVCMVGAVTGGCGPSSDPVDPALANANPENGTPAPGGASVQQTVD